MMKLMKLNTILVLAVMVFTVLSANNSMAAKPGVAVSNLAPDFEVTNLEGETFKLSDFRGKKPVYLVFWATWCPTCKREIPQFKKLQAELGDKVEIMAVNVDSLSWWSSLTSSSGRVKKYAKKYELNYAVALDDEKKLIELYHVRGTPTQLLIDKKGVIRRRYPIFNEKTARILQSIL